jgi:predicted RecB family nuclease
VDASLVLTDEVFVAFLKCRYKAYLKLQSSAGEPSDYACSQAGLTAAYRATATDDLLQKYAGLVVVRDPPSLVDSVRSGAALILEATASDAGESCRLDALEKVADNPVAYRPTLFVPQEKVAADDRLVLGFGASILARVQGTPITTGRIIHGKNFKPLRVELPTLWEPVGDTIQQVRGIAAAAKPPPLVLNEHCPECEFRRRCRTTAIERDDLSLLTGLTPKKIAALHARGIFTVAQFSHTFRPRRKKSAEAARTHDYALQALAIRENTIYVAEKPKLPSAGVHIYLDVEGLPDRNFYYLIGLVICDGAARQEHSFWADWQQDESRIWESFLRTVGSIGEFTLFHYGSYEAHFFRRMGKLYGGDPTLLGKLQTNTVNVVSLLYSRVYLPVYANDLKSVASYLGFRWSAEEASGRQSVVWRRDWETTGDDRLRQQLVTYNLEDCRALEQVMGLLSTVAQDAGAEGTAQRITAVEDIKQESRGNFGKGHYFFPELAWITKCSYFDYQRERILFRTSPAFKNKVRSRAGRPKTGYRPNTVVACSVPERCPHCSAADLKVNRRYAKTVLDLKLSRAGVKRWVTRYTTRSYKCNACGCPFLPDDYLAISATRYGYNLCAWVVYSTIDLRQTNENVAECLADLFGYSNNPGRVSEFRKRAATYYAPTYAALLERLRTGRLIHADETKVSVRGRSTNGYVWAFANPGTVVYQYAPTRDGTVVRTALAGFGGVLVSDFYTAYDSLNCPQQKCLIHLVRDFNDDLFTHPFDEELKQLAHEFTLLLQVIVQTIDRFGLKRLHLAKHQRDVDRFYARLAGTEYQSETAAYYQQRLLKYKDKLFTFLKHDGVPWSNNNGENAIKRVVALRKVLGTAFSEDGIKDYMVLLSIAQTLRYRRGSFWWFLLSRETDLDAFLARKR